MQIMLRTKTLEMGGIYRDDFIKYFLKIGGNVEDQETIKGPFWNIRLGSENWTMVGSLRIQYVFVTFNVEEDKFDEFLAKFRLNFLKAGG